MFKLTRLSLGLLLAIGAILTAGYLTFYFFGYRDCLWTGTGQTWLDENENGRWETTEPALADVRFRIDDTRNGYTDVGDEAISDDTGTADLTVWLPGCPRTTFVVSAEPPPAYSLTTASRLSARGEAPLAFGFAPQTPSPIR